MSESKHTPGPWIAEPADDFGDCNIMPINGSDAMAIGVAVLNLRSAEEVAANAALIAAAPELLAALEMQVRNCPVCKGTRKAVDVFDMLTSDGPHEKTECKRCAPGWAAIAKATGEPVEMREAS